MSVSRAASATPTPSAENRAGHATERAVTPNLETQPASTRLGNWAELGTGADPSSSAGLLGADTPDLFHVWFPSEALTSSPTCLLLSPESVVPGPPASLLGRSQPADLRENKVVAVTLASQALTRKRLLFLSQAGAKRSPRPAPGRAVPEHAHAAPQCGGVRGCVGPRSRCQRSACRAAGPRPPRPALLQPAGPPEQKPLFILASWASW